MTELKTSAFTSYNEFWPFYLSQHSNRKARLLHVIGTLLALLALFKAIVCLSIAWLSNPGKTIANNQSHDQPS
ncbi:MAG: Mpo1-like protein, partial [Alphaproteobacteria bacterium]